MSPAEIDAYTAQVDQQLRSPPRRLETSELEPYTPGNAAEQRPLTFGYVFVDFGDEGWKILVQGFRLAIATLYPEAAVATVNFVVEHRDLVPVVGTQAYAKLRRTFRGDLILIDPDVICRRRCDPFGLDFDVGLTDSKEKWPFMPFNSGVQFYKDTTGAQKYLDTVMEIASHIPQGIAPWYANQQAMRLAYEMLRGEVRFKIFPHEQFNYSPDVVAPTDAYFVHLKGTRKKMIRDYLVPVLENRVELSVARG